MKKQSSFTSLQHFVTIFVAALFLIHATPIVAQDLKADFTYSVNWNNPYAITFTSTSTGRSITEYEWQFGDNTQPEIKQTSTSTHWYATGGDYTVRLIIRGSGDNNVVQTFVEKTINVSTTLKAKFIMSTTTGVAPTTVNLDATSSTGSVIGVSWTIRATSGQPGAPVPFTYILGTNSTDARPTVRFDVKGTYAIKVTVTSLAGQSSTSAEQTVSVNEFFVDFTYDQPVYENIEVQFWDASKFVQSCPAQPVPTYQWTFPTMTSTLNNPRYTFTSTGDYTVTLTIDDGCGKIASVSKTIKVTTGSGTLQPKFTASATTIRRGSTVRFTDQSTSTGSPITEWSWYFNLPKDFDYPGFPPGYPDYYHTYRRDYVDRTYDIGGYHRVKLIVHKDSSFPVASDLIIGVEEIPEIKPITEIPKGEPGALSASFFITSHLDNNSFAGVFSTPTTGNTFHDFWFKVAKKSGSPGSKFWVATNYVKFTNHRIYEFRVRNKKAVFLRKSYDMPTTEPFSFIAIDDIEAPQAVPYDNITSSALLSPAYYSSTTRPRSDWFPDPFWPDELPQFDRFENEIVHIQREADGAVYLYLISKGSTWSTSTRTKTKIITSGGSFGRVFFDDKTIIAHVNGKINIYLKGTAWNFSAPQRVISSSLPFEEICYNYSGNAIAASLLSTNFTTNLNGPLLFVYEKPLNGWVTTSVEKCWIKIDTDTEINSGTNIKVSEYPRENSISMSNNVICVKAALKNGTGDPFRRYFVYRKAGTNWSGDISQTYKINEVNENYSYAETSDYDVMHCDYVSGPYSQSTPIYMINLESYCYVNPLLKTDYTFSGMSTDINIGEIVLNNVLFKAGAFNRFKTLSITLKPGTVITKGSDVGMKAVLTCDELYQLK